MTSINSFCAKIDKIYQKNIVAMVFNIKQIINLKHFTIKCKNSQ